MVLALYHSLITRHCSSLQKIFQLKLYWFSVKMTEWFNPNAMVGAGVPPIAA
jgi:hypothetical protein